MLVRARDRDHGRAVIPARAALRSLLDPGGVRGDGRRARAAGGDLAGAGTHVSAWDLVPGELLAGAGIGLALPPLFDFILAGVKDHEVGSASGVLNAIQQFAAALGVAVFATVFFAYLDAKHPPVAAMKWTTLLTLIPLGLAFLAVLRLPRRPRDAGAH